MNFLLDACISRFAVVDLRAAGYDVAWVLEWERDPGDEEVLKSALSEGRILVTVDKDFGELIFVSGLPHPAIVRLVDIPAKQHGVALLEVIDRHHDELNSSALITVEPGRVRIRKA